MEGFEDLKKEFDALGDAPFDSKTQNPEEDDRSAEVDRMEKEFEQAEREGKIAKFEARGPYRLKNEKDLVDIKLSFHRWIDSNGKHQGEVRAEITRKNGTSYSLPIPELDTQMIDEDLTQEVEDITQAG